MKIFAIVVLALGLVPMVRTAAEGADERPITVVFEIEDRNKTLSKATRDQLTDYLASLLTKGGYQVVPRAQLQERLAEAKAGSYKACYDQACQVELGRELAAQKSLASQVLKLGKKCKVTINLYDLKRAASEGAGAADCRSCKVDDIVAGLEEAARSLMPGAGPASPLTAPAAPAGEITEVGERIAAYEQGEKEHAYDIGMAYLDGHSGAPQNFTKAKQWFAKAAAHGDVAAYTELGERYRLGQGTRKNAKEAVKWFRKAAEAGDPVGQYKLGVMIHNGEGAEQDHAEAAKWFSSACEKGELAEPCASLGSMYLMGVGVVKGDKAKALKWYLKADELGDNTAASAIALIYEYGAEGVPADKGKALEWLKAGAKYNYAPAMKQLGEAYAGKGYSPLTEPNMVEAYKWLAVYIEKDIASGRAEEIIEEITTKMSPADLERAKKEAAELIERYVTPQDREEKARFKAHPEEYR